MPRIVPMSIVFLIVAAVMIPIVVFKLSDLEGNVLTFKARPINDTSYLSRFYQIKYRSLTEMYSYLKNLVKSYSFFCRLSVVGYTSKKGALRPNPIYLLKISSGFPKPIILILAGINANDWQTVTSVFYIANQLLSNCTKVGGMITAYDWYLVPIVNPDGYNYSQSMPAAVNWVKNIAQWSMEYQGVNLDYNFGYHWRKDYNFNEDTYPGIKAFSEHESKALRSLILDIHHYTELVFILKSPLRKMPQEPTITYPWSYSIKRSHNWILMEYLGLVGARAAKNATKTTYKVVQSGRLVKNQTGRIDDWILAETNIRRILTIQTKYVADYIHGPYGSILYTYVYFSNKRNM